MVAVAGRMSMRAYAAHRKAAGLPGGTLSAVQKALKSGRIKKDRHGKIDPSEADATWSRKTDPTQGKPLEKSQVPAPPATATPGWSPSAAGWSLAGSHQDPLDLVQERARLAKAQADKHELDNAERAGLLINRDLAMHVFSTQIASAKNRLVGMGSKLATELCGVLGVQSEKAIEVEEVIDREVREILEELSAAAAESEIR